MIHLLLAVIYISFISLGLPDGLLGAGWPAMYPQFGVPVSFAGILSMIIAGGTIVSSLQSDRLTRRFGAGKVTAVSVAMTAAALFGFSFSTSFWALILWAIPYGLGAGGVDAALNNYVAVHYSSRHMNWLHCMWGIGAATGPYIMGMCIQGPGWQSGYMIVGGIQVVLTAVLFISLPLWKGRPDAADGSGASGKAPALLEVIRVPGAKQIMLTFFCYCALEQTAMLWASSYFSLSKGMSDENAAFFGSLFLIGITVGRFISGFLAAKMSDRQMIRLGQGLMAAGIIVLFVSFNAWSAILGFLLIGLGCAPVYPCIIHSTPALFGADRSQAVVGIEMASAYIGTLAMPPLFGLLAQSISINVLPYYLAGILVVMVVAYAGLIRNHREADEKRKA